ncbi:MAG: hypothetical protein ACYTHJ_16690 [Planctomycetota bacterium]
MRLSLDGLLVVLALLLVRPAPARPLVNGDFEADPTELVGWTVDGAVQVITLGDKNRVALIQENTAGAFIRFYQEFELPDNPT